MGAVERELGSGRILIVVSDQSLRQELATLVRRSSSYRVTEYESADEALDAISAEPPEAIVAELLS